MAEDTQELDDYLDSLPDKIRAELSGVIQEQAEMLSDAQRQALQALEQSEPTGDLVESCTVVAGANDLEWIVQAGGDLTSKEVREGSGVDYDYAEAFEFGTSRQHAKPFFWPTYQEKRDGILQTISEAVDKALK